MTKRLLPVYEDDTELRTICICVTHLSKLGWTAQWRVVSYLVIRFLGPNWALPTLQREIG